MPLSEHEQRLLDQIERALYAEDPKFATTVRSTDLRTHMRRRLRRAAFVFAVGFVLLVAGVPTAKVWISVVGFVVMLLALLLALSAWRRLGGPSATPARGKPAQQTERGERPARRGSHSTAKERNGLRARLEDRWKRRWDERGR